MSGIRGKQSSLVGEVFRLIEAAKQKPKWLLLENVPFMLSLHRGRAMAYLTRELGTLGYIWAYRTVDSRSFGLPQRRKRVLLLASRSADPREVLFADESGSEPKRRSPAKACGFYWTEGNNGLGWAPDAVPPLKGGSGCGIPSPPAIWIRSERRIVTPDVRDAERLQGFPEDWTVAADAVAGARKGTRWRLVGNAVSVAVAEWLGRRITKPESPQADFTACLDKSRGWPSAAWGSNGQAFRVEASHWPIRAEVPCLLDFLRHPTLPLSARATAGFLGRARASRLKFEEGFLEDVAWHLHKMERSGPSNGRKEPARR
jgi:DNA (cytosine-5)-methyltransferase 1